MATSYANPCGSGNRTTTVLVTATSSHFSTPVDLPYLLDGSTTDNHLYFLAGMSGVILEFWFPSKKIIDEAKFYQQFTSSHGTWKWQGSNDRVTWTDIGGTFTLGGVTTQTFTTLAGNVTGYVFYRLFQTAGTTSSSPYLHEFEFKIDDAAGTTSYVNALGSGNRTATITITSSGITWLGAGGTAPLVDGTRTGGTWWNADATNAGDWVQFDLGAAYVVQQARLFQDTTGTQGDWKLQGSPDASTWTDISAAVTVGIGIAPFVTCFGGGESNTTAYRYYRLLGVSGGRTTALYESEVEFMVAATGTPTGLSYVTGTSPLGGGTATTNPLDTTGATLLVLSVSQYTGSGSTIATVSDNKGNTWTPLTLRNAGNAAHRFFYVTSPVVGTGHVVTVTGTFIYAVVSFYACPGHRSFQVETGATTTAAGPLATGSVTPSANGALVFSGWAGMNLTSNPTVGSGLTAISQNPVTNYCVAGATGYLIQSTAAAINPTWSWTGTDHVAEAVAVFLVAAPAGAASVRVTQDAIEVLSLPTPDARITQSVVEVLGTIASVTPTTTITQAAVELLSREEHAGHITQLCLEVFVAHRVPARATQYAIEIFSPHVVPVRATQGAVEYFQAQVARLRASQVVVEIFRPPVLPGPCPVDLPLDADSVNDCASDFPIDPDVVPY